MITTQQKTKILQIVNIFETGSKQGKYDNISIYADGKNNTKQITYGRSQTTEQGNLKTLLQLYIDKNGIYATQLKPYLTSIGKTPLHNNIIFKKLLQKAAREDIKMIETQYQFFDILYYQPAFHFFEKNKFTQALSLLVIYDSYIHSGSIPTFLREKFPENTPLNKGNEKNWIKQYTNERHDWLKNNKKNILQKTIYRTQCFLNQIKTENWDLSKELIANGIKI